MLCVMPIIRRVVRDTDGSEEGAPVPPDDFPFFVRRLVDNGPAAASNSSQAGRTVLNPPGTPPHATLPSCLAGPERPH